jgi:prevent-host-death family protein
MEVSVHEAKTTLSQLLRRVAAGESVVISRRGKPTAKLVPWNPPPKRRKGGLDRGLFTIPEGFDEEDPEVHRLFNG